MIGGNISADGTGRTCPGYPRKKIVEVYGPEASGKTTAALEAIVEVQKAGGCAMFLDFEHALHHGYAKAIGVDFSETSLLYYKPNTLEEGMNFAFAGIRQGVDLIVVDSVAAMVPQAELEKSPGDARKIGAQAQAMSDILPKLVIRLDRANPDDPDCEGSAVIFLNQTRATIQTGGGGRPSAGDNENTSGGKALKFYADVRLRVCRVRSDYVKRKDRFSGKDRNFPVGTFTNVKVVKNKEDMTNGYSGDFYIRYGLGIDDYLTVIESGVVHKIIRKSGSSYEWKEFKAVGRDKFRKILMDNPAQFKALEEELRNMFMASTAEVIEDIDEEEFEADLGYKAPVPGIDDADDGQDLAVATEAEVTEDD